MIGVGVMQVRAIGFRAIGFRVTRLWGLDVMGMRLPCSK